MASMFLLSSFANAEGVNLNGTWTGQAQFQATIGGEVVQSAHSVNTFMLIIEPHGKVIGVSKENGCKLLGIASPGIAATILTLDVTLSECAYKDYNYRYKGHLSFFDKKGHAKFELQFIKIRSGSKAKSANIKATLFRQK